MSSSQSIDDLFQAAKRGDIDAVNRLISEGADVNATSELKEAPLHSAARNNNKEVVEALLGKDGINVNIGGQDGKKTPLHLAAQNNNKEIVDALIKAGVNINVKDKDEKTPLDLTTNEEIRTLLKAAENPGDGSVDKPSTDNEENSEEDAGVQQGTTSAGQGTAEHPAPVKPSTPAQNHGGQTSTTSAGQGTDIKAEGVEPVASTEPAQTEEQPSSFLVVCLVYL